MRRARRPARAPVAAGAGRGPRVPPPPRCRGQRCAERDAHRAGGAVPAAAQLPVDDIVGLGAGREVPVDRGPGDRCAQRLVALVPDHQPPVGRAVPGRPREPARPDHPTAGQPEGRTRRCGGRRGTGGTGRRAGRRPERRTAPIGPGRPRAARWPAQSGPASTTVRAPTPASQPRVGAGSGRIGTAVGGSDDLVSHPPPLGAAVADTISSEADVVGGVVPAGSAARRTARRRGLRPGSSRQRAAREAVLEALAGPFG